MKKLAMTVMLISPPVFAAYHPTAPESAALKFNEWYMTQLIADTSPLDSVDRLQPYVTADTFNALKTLYSGDSNGKDMPDADPFIKAQDVGRDWNQLNVLMSDADPVCTNIYIAFGKMQKHVVADCMIEEAGKWKVRSATLISALP